MKSFTIAAVLLFLATAGAAYQASRGVDVSGAERRAQHRAAQSAAHADELPPAIPITIDGVNVRTGAPPVPGPARLLARAVTLRVSTDHFHDIRDAIDRLVSAHHGVLVGVMASPAASSLAGTSQRALTATVTVPLGESDDALADARRLGHVLQEMPSMEDVTESDRLLLLRAGAARTEDRRLTGLLSAGAPGIQDLAGLQRAQSSARAEADRVTTEEAALVARTTVLTMTLKIEGR